MTGQLPLAIRTINERLHFPFKGPERVGRFEAFTVDLSDWKLSLTDQTPCFWIHSPEHLSLSGGELANEIQDAVRQRAWQNETILVLCDGPAEALRRTLRSASTQFAVLDEEQQKRAHEAPSPTGVMLDNLLNQIARSHLAPYETSRPVIGSRFFGRQSYINRILHNGRTNFLIIGERRIGKSSLLREIERHLNKSDPCEEGRQRRLYVDCSVIGTAEDFYREIVARLSPRDLKLLERSGQSQRLQARIFEYLAVQQNGPITFLLDEIDRLLENAGPEQELFKVLRRASQQGDSARFIIAGFRHARRAVNDLEKPFYNFCETFELEAFDRVEVKQMVEGPMELLRVKLEGRDEIIQRIYRETAGLPNLVQFYCQSLLEQMEREGASTISTQNLQSVYDNNIFRDFVLTTFLGTSLPLERAVVCALITGRSTRSSESTSLKEIDAELARNRLTVQFNALDEACRNLETAGILQRRGKQFSFRIPLFAKMLEETYPVDYILDKAREEIDARDSLAPVTR